MPLHDWTHLPHRPHNIYTKTEDILQLLVLCSQSIKITWQCYISNFVQWLQHNYIKESSLKTGVNAKGLKKVRTTGNFDKISFVMIPHRSLVRNLNSYHPDPWVYSPSPKPQDGGIKFMKTLLMVKYTVSLDPSIPGLHCRWILPACSNTMYRPRRIKG